MKISFGIKALAASVLAAGALASTPAAAAEFIGTVSSTYNTDVSNGLAISEHPLHSSFDFILNNVGDHFTMSLFDLYTTEGQIDPDDLAAKAISVAFNFTAPVSHTTPISGDTMGNLEQHKGYNIQFGSIDWLNGGIGTLAFGNGGLLQIALGGDTTFNQGTNGLGDTGYCYCNAAEVDATFTLEHLSTAVPEPYEWALMLLGVGLVGANLRQGRRRAATATA